MHNINEMTKIRLLEQIFACTSMLQLLYIILQNTCNLSSPLSVPFNCDILVIVFCDIPCTVCFGLHLGDAEAVIQPTLLFLERKKA
jgi:hypothetical protein